MTVVGQLMLIGLALTLVSSLVAVVFVMRYEPLQILAERS
jgi:putative ABC transport system permease protein